MQDEILFQTDRTLIIVDCRDLFPPEPMEQVLIAIEQLKINEAVVMLHRMKPVPLFKFLQDRNFQFELKEQNNGHIQLLIWR
ncbi:MAG: hypothetical protein ACI86H_002514 [bacterium]|jgi:uncharacterized protein (DUF2249 family)